ncbi:MAG: EamA family transporter, partial [Planctomycetes bacterium]|nr:EamA family transporter [Planctomycetota bacterium]
MTWLAIILVCISAVFHAAWNLISKKSDPSAPFFAVAMCFGALLTSPLLILYFDTYSLLSSEVWIGTILTGIWQTMYFFSLAASYRHGDISIAYPLARSSPLIVVTISGLILGHGDLISWLCIIGVLVIVAGTFLLPMKSFTDFSVKNYINKM